MRRILLLLALTAGFVACKKDHTCTCTLNMTEPLVFNISVDTVIKDTKSKAKKACEKIDDDAQKDLNEPGVKGTASCKLK